MTQSRLSGKLRAALIVSLIALAGAQTFAQIRFTGPQPGEARHRRPRPPDQVAVVHHRPTALLSLRDPWPSAAGGIGRWRHRLLWARQRATGAWTVEHLAWVGSELYANQPDYCGLGTIDPLDPTRAVVSSDVDPASGEPLAVAVPGGRPHRELFEGRRTAEGRWRWRALTSASTVDHLRPLLVSGGGRTVLAWMRGTYRSWTDFDTDLVVRTA